MASVFGSTLCFIYILVVSVASQRNQVLDAVLNRQVLGQDTKYIREVIELDNHIAELTENSSCARSMREWNFGFGSQSHGRGHAYLQHPTGMDLNHGRFRFVDPKRCPTQHWGCVFAAPQCKGYREDLPGTLYFCSTGNRRLANKFPDLTYPAFISSTMRLSTIPNSDTIKLIDKLPEIIGLTEAVPFKDFMTGKVGRYVSVHIRHGDKGGEAKLVKFDAYARAINEIHRKTGITQVFLSSDDSKANQTMVKLCPKMNFHFIPPSMWSPKNFRRGTNRSPYEVEYTEHQYDDGQLLAASMFLFSHSMHFIGTQTSNMGRLVYEWRLGFEKRPKVHDVSNNPWFPCNNPRSPPYGCNSKRAICNATEAQMFLRLDQIL